MLCGASVEFLTWGIQGLAQHSVLYHFHTADENVKSLQIVFSMPSALLDVLLDTYQLR